MSRGYITDPKLLAQLNAPTDTPEATKTGYITDPRLLAQLNAPASPLMETPEHMLATAPTRHLPTLPQVGEFLGSLALSPLQSQISAVPRSGMQAPQMAGFMPIPSGAFPGQPQQAATIRGFNLGQQLGIPQTAAARAGTMTGEIGSMALPIAGGLARLLPEELPEAAEEIPEAIEKQLEVTPELKKAQNNVINRAYLATKRVSDNNYQHPLNTYGEDIIDRFKTAKSPSGYETVKNVSYAGKSVDPQWLIEKHPETAQQLVQEGYLKPAAEVKPLKHHLDGDEYDLANQYVKKALKRTEKNPSLSNLHYFSKELGNAAADSDFPDKTNLTDLRDKIENEFILPHLREKDALHGTQTALPYENAREFYKRNLAPFKATKKLHSISLGLHNMEQKVPNPATLKDVLKEIGIGRTTASKYIFNPQTGLPEAMIPQDHYLTQIQPNLEQELARQERRTLLKGVAGKLAKHKAATIGGGLGALGTLEMLRRLF